MSRSKAALVASLFAFGQFAVAIVSGFVMFPIIVGRLGAYDNGLWIAAGDVVGYLALTDMGIFAVLPWLVAECDGRHDGPGISRLLSDAIALALLLVIVILAAAFAVDVVSAGSLGVGEVDFEKLRRPLVTLLLLSAAVLPTRPFYAALYGLQDNTFVGSMNLLQAIATIGLTAGLILSDWGILGLAVAVGVPPVVAGWAAVARFIVTQRRLLPHLTTPSVRRSKKLLTAGIGGWLGGLGVRLMSATSGLVYGLVGQPAWATYYSATGKASTVAQPVAAVIPENALVGLSQLSAKRDPQRLRETAVCIVLLHLLIVGVAALGILVANPWFLGVWLGDKYYAGDGTHFLIVANLLVGSLVGGLYRVTAVVGNRLKIGVATLLYGALAVVFGWTLTRTLGLIGMPLGMLLATCIFALPVGVATLRSAFDVDWKSLFEAGLLRWIAVIAPLAIVSGWIGMRLRDAPAAVVVAAAVAILAAYGLGIRPIVARMPWPAPVKIWLTRLRLISAPPAHISNPLTTP